MNNTEEPNQPLETDNTIHCEDLDSDCEDVICKLGCWMFDRDKGMCPYLI